jgi:uncharacterized membrane protein YtjA (UPF0391 family)
MLRLALLFLVIAMIAAVFNFAGVEGFALDAARILFFLFLVVAVLFFIANFLRGAPPRDIV